MSNSEEIDLSKEISIDNTTNDTNLLQLRDSPFCLPLRMNGFTSEKEQAGFLKNVEKLVRNSLEYKLWVSYVTSTLGYNKCSLTHEKIIECPLDVHHHPFTLYSIVKLVTDSFIEKNIAFNGFDVGTRVMELHYQNKIGYIVLLSNIHSKYHNGYQKLPIEHVHGDYKFLFENFNVEEQERASIYELWNIHIEDCKLDWSSSSYPGLQEEKKE